MDNAISTIEILNNGMQCLTEKLGIVEKWQNTHFDKMTAEEFNEAASQYAKDHPYRGNAKVIL